MNRSEQTEWKMILGPGRRAEVEGAWKEWLEAHDVSKLGPRDIKIETGRAKGGDISRISIRRDAVHNIVPPVNLDEDA